MVNRTIASWLMCSLGFAQSPADLFSKAPPAIDDALRARITKFYEAHRDGKFRLADQLVAEDSKDTFFESDKRRCKAFDVSKVSYDNPEFTRASVLILCLTSMMMPPAGQIEVKMPLSSKWKVVDGDWFWYVEQSDGRASPFGKMLPGTGTQGGLPTALPKGPDPKDLMRMVSIDKSIVKFSVGKAGVDELVVSSELPGEAHLSVDGVKMPDIKIEFEKTVLHGRQSSKVVARYKPDAEQPRRQASTAEFRILVQPLNKIIPVQIAFN